MDVIIEPAQWPNQSRDPHWLVAAGLALLAGYLLLVLLLAILRPDGTGASSPDVDRRVPVRIKTRAAPERPVMRDAGDVSPEPTSMPLPRAAPGPAAEAAITDEPDATPATPPITGRIDLTMPEPEPMRRMPPVCRAGPCAPGAAAPGAVAPGAVAPSSNQPGRRAANRGITGLDPEVLKGMDTESLGIEPDFGDIFGERRVAVSRNCDLVKPEDNAVTRQMGMPGYLRCRRSTASKERAQALLDALREKRPDLFETPER